MAIKIAVILNQEPREELKSILSTLQYDSIFLPSFLASDFDNKNVYAFEDPKDIIRLIEEFKIECAFVIGTPNWSIPLPCPSIRLLPEFSNSYKKLSQDQKGNLFRRSELFVCFGSPVPWGELSPNACNPIIMGYEDRKDLTRSTVENLVAAAIKKRNPKEVDTKLKFHIVTPSFNQAIYIERTIQSVLSQTYSNFIYTVIDGNSTDSTIEILKKYSPQLSWISEKDDGYADAVNKGFQNSTADYFLWLPSDDLLQDSFTLARFAEIIHRTHADVVYGEAFYCDENDRSVDYYKTHEFDRDLLRDNCFICQPATIFSREAFKMLGGLDTKLKSIADYDFWLKCSDSGLRFVRTGFANARYRLHQNSITISQRKKTYKEIFELQLQRYGYVSKNWVLGAIYEISSSHSSISKPQTNKTKRFPFLRKILRKLTNIINTYLIKYLLYAPPLQRILLIYLKRNV